MAQAIHVIHSNSFSYLQTISHGMFNDPELSGKYLGTITQDFVKVADTLKEASYQIRKAGFAFPIFVIAKEEITIGQLLIPKEPLNLVWNYNASYLDEFVQRELVAADKQEDFKNRYKDPDEFCCLFVVDNEFASFVYIPFPED
jgi:hypothetical protein